MSSSYRIKKAREVKEGVSQQWLVCGDYFIVDMQDCIVGTGFASREAAAARVTELEATDAP